MPLSRWVAQREPYRGGYAGPSSGNFRTRAAILPSEQEFSITGDVVAWEEREPRITPTGVLDHRGMMLVRITVPIKEHIGFARDLDIEREPDEVETILPEDMLAVSDCGLGVGFVTPAEVDGGEEDDEGVTPEMMHDIIRAALEKCDGDADAARALLAEMGIEVEFTVEARTP
jgi:hypothetical protein